MTRCQREQACDRHQLLLTAREAIRVAIGEHAYRQCVDRRLRAAQHLVTIDPQVHRSKGDLLVGRGRHPGELRSRVLESDRHVAGHLMHGASRGVRAVDEQTPAERAAQGSRREAARHQAER